MTTGEKKFDVLVVGELNVDLILNQLQKFPELGKEILAGEMVFTLGSSAAIFACNLSVLGASVAFLGKTGNDDFAQKITRDLMSAHVNVKHILQTTSAATGISVAVNYDQDRAMITYPGAMEELTADEITDDTLAEARHLHVSSVFLQKGLKPGIVALFQRAKQIGMTTSLDPQWDPAERWDLDLTALLPYVDIFFPNITELRHLTQRHELPACIAAVAPYARILAVKDGDNGAWLWESKHLRHQAPFLNEQVADCIGAGDSFNAGFIKKYVDGCPLDECLEFAALTGAVNTTCPGGTGAFRDREIFLSIAKETFNYQNI